METTGQCSNIYNPSAIHDTNNSVNPPSYNTTSGGKSNESMLSSIPKCASLSVRQRRTRSRISPPAVFQPDSDFICQRRNVSSQQPSLSGAKKG